jgi:hypothetical protein
MSTFLTLLFKITIAQIHLTKDNLDQVCNYESSQADETLFME